MKGQPMQPYQKDVPIKSRLEELRAVLRSESISYGELHELASLKAYIEDDDVELLEPAGVPDGDCGVCGVYRCREDHDVQE